MADFGINTVGGILSFNMNKLRGTKITPTISGSMDSITVYVASGWSSGGKIKLILYDASGNLIAETPERNSGSSGATWEAFPFVTKPAVTAGTTYYLALFSSTNVQYALQSSSAGNPSGTRTYPTAPNPCTIVSDFQASMYATVTESGGNVKVYNGTSFVAKPVKVWNGTAWVAKPLKVYNGTAWVATNY